MAAFLSWSTKSGASKSLFFDVCTEEHQELSSAATENPVEEGADVADHVRKELNRVTLEVFVSQTPIFDMNDKGGKVDSVPIKPPKFTPPLQPTPGSVFGAAGDAVRNLLGGAPPEYSAQVLQWSSSFDAVADTLTVLEKVRDDVELVSVVTPSRVRENMYLERIEVIGNAGTGTGRTLRLSFRELRKVQVRIVNAPIPTETRGQLMKPKGTQGAKEVSPDAAKRLRSALDWTISRFRR